MKVVRINRSKLEQLPLSGKAVFHLFLLGGRKLRANKLKWVSTPRLADEFTQSGQTIYQTLERAKVRGIVSINKNPSPENRVHHNIKYAKPTWATYWKPTPYGIKYLKKRGVLVVREID